MINRLILTLYAFSLTAVSLLAQAASGPVSSPQRGVTYADDPGDGSLMLLLAGGAFVLLLIVFLALRRKNAPTRNKLHKY